MPAQHELTPNLQQLVDTCKAQQPTAKEDDMMQQRLSAKIAAYSEAPQYNTGQLRGLFTSLQQRISALWQVPAMRWMSSAAAACAVVLSVFVITSTPTPAFASMVQQLARISTMYYHGTMTSHGQALVQLKVYYQAPHHVRVENTPLQGKGENASMINIIDGAEGKGLILMPQAKMAIPFSFEPNTAQPTAQDDPLYWFDTVLNYKGEVQHLPAKTIDDVDVVGYRIKDNGITITIWADVTTQLPLNINVTMDEINGQIPFMLQADLQFNQPLDAALFSVTPDTSYTLGRADNDR
jgi:outer membrane lipoprotein-sorting protein